MRLHFATIPIHDSERAETELNGFLASHRVLAVERHLVLDGPNTVWAVCVSYTTNRAPITPSATHRTPKKGRVDYKEVLSAEQFAVFAELRTLRKELADRDGVPPYSVFNNEQLAEMVVERIDSAAVLGRIAGVGPSRVEKYGKPFLSRLAELRASSGTDVTDAAGGS